MPVPKTAFYIFIAGKVSSRIYEETKSVSLSEPIKWLKIKTSVAIIDSFKTLVIPDTSILCDNF